jgi:AraC-like DNA-binding protein
VSQGNVVKARFFAPPAHMRRYFTTFYLVEFEAPHGRRVSDNLLPEWGNLRFCSGDAPDAWTMSGQKLSGTRFPVTGPSSEGVRFALGSTRMWGIGLLPLGWAKFVGYPASDFANVAVDGHSSSAFSGFRLLARTLFSDRIDVQGELNRIVGYFQARIFDPVPDEARIMAIHSAIIDPEVTTVAELADRAGASPRTIERLCRRHFGFAPKLLLRRQRFLRSLTQFMLNPAQRWIEAMDSHYHDQAQFVRDCHDFLGMTPRQFAALDKPLTGAIMRARVQITGSAAQALDKPGGTEGA